MACAEKIHFRSHLFSTVKLHFCTKAPAHTHTHQQPPSHGSREVEGGSERGFLLFFHPKAPLLDLPNSYICIKIRLSSLSFIVPVRSRVEVRNISLPALTKTNLQYTSGAARLG